VLTMWQPAPTTTATYAEVFAMQIAKKSAGDRKFKPVDRSPKERHPW